MGFSHSSISLLKEIMQTGMVCICVCMCVCVFVFEKPRKPVLTFLSACDPLLTGLTQSINKMSLKTNQKTKEMNPHLNKDNIIIVAG